MNKDTNVLKLTNDELKKKIDSLIKLAVEKRKHDFEYSTNLAMQAYNLSNDINYKKGQMESSLALGVNIWQKGELEESIEYLMNSLEIAEALKDEVNIMKCLNALGNCYFDFQNYQIALNYYNKTLIIAKKCEDKLIEALSLNNIGEIFNKLKSYKEALKYYFESMKMLEELNDFRMNIVELNIGDIYYHFKDYEKAEFYIRKSLKSLKKEKYIKGEVECYIKLGRIRCKQKQIEKAKKYYNQALDIIDKASYKIEKIDILMDLQKISYEENKFEKSVEYLNNALEIAKELKIKAKISMICVTLAKLYEGVNQYKEALKYYKIYHDIEKDETVLREENKLKSLKIQMTMEQTKSEREIYRLKNIELNEKNDELEKKTLELEKSYEDVKIISQIGKNITATLDLDEIFKMVYSCLKNLMNVNTFGVGLYNKESRDIEYKYFVKNDIKLPIFTQSIDSEYSIAAECIRNNKAIVINNLFEHFKNDYNKYFLDYKNFGKKLKTSVQSVIYCPLVIEDNVIGMITVQSDKKNAYSQYNLNTINALASYIAIAINNAFKSQKLEKANEKLLNLSQMDPLTGILNRRRFIEIIDMEWKHCRRISEHLSVIMIDIDKFKEYNDNYGHLAGDSVIIKIAKTIKEALKRSTDYVARYGGDEFIVVLPSTDKEGAVVVANKIKNQIAELKLEHKYSTISNIVTLTLGVSTMIPKTEKRVEELIHMADEALYLAKSKGRNTVEAL